MIFATILELCLLFWHAKKKKKKKKNLFHLATLDSKDSCPRDNADIDFT